MLHTHGFTPCFVYAASIGIKFSYLLYVYNSTIYGKSFPRKTFTGNIRILTQIHPADMTLPGVWYWAPLLLTSPPSLDMDRPQLTLSTSRCVASRSYLCDCKSLCAWTHRNHITQCTQILPYMLKNGRFWDWMVVNTCKLCNQHIVCGFNKSSELLHSLSIDTLHL